MPSPSRPIPESELIEAAQAFSLGALLGVFPQADYVILPISGPGVGSYERAAHCASEMSQQSREHRARAVTRCLELAAASRRLRAARAA